MYGGAHNFMAQHKPNLLEPPPLLVNSCFTYCIVFPWPVDWTIGLTIFLADSATWPLIISTRMNSFPKFFHKLFTISCGCCVTMPQYYTQYCTCCAIHISVLTCNLHSTMPCYISGVPIHILLRNWRKNMVKHSMKPRSKSYFCLHETSYRRSTCSIEYHLGRDRVCLLYRIANLLSLLFPLFHS